MKKKERWKWLHSVDFIVNFEQVSHIILGFQLLTFKQLIPNGTPQNTTSKYTFYFYIEQTDFVQLGLFRDLLLNGRG